MSTAFQDHYPHDFSHCYGCGTNNAAGHQLKSHWDGDVTVARFHPAATYTGGVPDHVYGGLVASLMDCHGNASAFAFAHRDLGLDMASDAHDPIRFVTASLKVDFRHPTPMGVELEIRGRLHELSGRKARIDMSLWTQGIECAVGEMLAIRLKTS